MAKRKKQQILALRSVRITSDALGGATQLTLGPGPTVLVGHNGAGKSAIIEGLHDALKDCIRTKHVGPDAFQASFDRNGAPLHFACTRRRISTVPKSVLELDGGEPQPEAWVESAWTTSRRKPLWKVSEGKLQVQGIAEGPIAPGQSLLWVAAQAEAIVSEADELAHYCRLVSRIPAGLPRAEAHRAELYLESKDGLRWSAVGAPDARLARLARRLVQLEVVDPEQFEVFREELERLEFVTELRVDRYAPEKNAGQRRLAAVSVDGVNLGLAADGTLRVIEILLELVVAPPQSLLLLEEPESGVHPGLLARLLNKLESAAHDLQLVISTHAPQVVSWAAPQDLRLVERRKGLTRARSLTKAEVQRVERYMHRDGTFGEYVFQVGLDDAS